MSHFRTLAVLPLKIQRYYCPGRYYSPYYSLKQVLEHLGGTTAENTAVLPPGQKLQITRYENFNNFCIRTPFLMILGSLESQRRALQHHAEKHHSPTRKGKTKWGKVRPLDKRTTGKTSNIKKAISFSYEIRF